MQLPNFLRRSKGSSSVELSDILTEKKLQGKLVKFVGIVTSLGQNLDEAAHVRRYNAQITGLNWEAHHVRIVGTPGYSTLISEYAALEESLKSAGEVEVSGVVIREGLVDVHSVKPYQP